MSVQTSQAVSPEYQEEHHGNHKKKTSTGFHEIFTPMHLSYETDSFHSPHYRIPGVSKRKTSSRLEHKDYRPESQGRRRETISSDESWNPRIKQMSFSVSAETSVSYVESVTGSFVQDLLHDDEAERSCEEFAPDAVGLMEHENKFHRMTASEEQLMMQGDARSTNTIAFFADLVKTERKSMANALLMVPGESLIGTQLAPRKARVSLLKDNKCQGQSKCCGAIRKCFRKLSRKLCRSRRKKRPKDRKSIYASDDSHSSDTDDSKCIVQGGPEDEESEIESEQLKDAKKFSEENPAIRNKLGIPKRIPLTAALVSIRIRIIHRKRTIAFFQFIMGMRIMRHEEHNEKEDLLVGDKYTGRWSKTVMAYDDDWFAIELIYYYDTKSFKKGNGLICLIVQNNEALFRAKQFDWPIKHENRLIAPGGYIFQIVDRPVPKDRDPISKIILTSTNLQNSIKFWCGFLEMNIVVEKRSSITLSYGKNQIKLELRYISPPFIQGDNTVRLKAVCPYSQLMELQLKFLKVPSRIKQQTTIYAYTKPTNVKIAVFVDYDGHEIAYIDQESYDKVRKYDAESVKTLKLHVKLSN